MSYALGMNPPFDITPRILKLTADISSMIGRLEGGRLKIPLVDLRRQIDASSIHSSCVIEGNALTLDQATDIINGKRVIGPAKDILEIKNANELYCRMDDFDPLKEKDLLHAHEVLMKGLGVTAGKLRRTGVVVRNQERGVVHVAPPYQRVPALLSDLFDFIRGAQDLHVLIASSVFHYEFEFIHPFEDGNGRLGRFWQALLLRRSQACFNLMPIETAVKDHQREYYEAIAKSSREGQSTAFIEFMLMVILEAALSLEKLVSRRAKPMDRIAFMMKHCPKKFTRKEYIQLVGDIAAHTASRDLREAVKQGLIEMQGTRARAVYRKTVRKS
jgi:Fic family protein